MHSCTLKHRPPVLPQDAVFQLFKPRLKLAAQPLEGKAGRIPVITVWLVEWLQLASLSLDDLHTYKKLREARCGYCEVPYSVMFHFRSWERRTENDLKKDPTDLNAKKSLQGQFSCGQCCIYCLYTASLCHRSQISQTRNRYHPLKTVWWNLFAPRTVFCVLPPGSNEESLSSGPPLS